MVNLKAPQQKIIDRLQSARADYDAGTREFEAALAKAQDVRKGAIRDLVAEAEAVGIPERRIFMALGFTQAAPYRNFMLPAYKEVKAAGGVDIGKLVELSVPKAKETVYTPEWDPDGVALGDYDVIGLTRNDEAEPFIWFPIEFIPNYPVNLRQLRESDAEEYPDWEVLNKVAYNFLLEDGRYPNFGTYYIKPANRRP